MIGKKMFSVSEKDEDDAFEELMLTNKKSAKDKDVLFDDFSKGAKNSSYRF